MVSQVITGGGEGQERIPDVSFHSDRINAVDVDADFGKIVFHHSESEHGAKVRDCGSQNQSEQSRASNREKL